MRQKSLRITELHN